MAGLLMLLEANEVSASMAKDAREKASMTLKVWNLSVIVMLSI